MMQVGQIVTSVVRSSLLEPGDIGLITGGFTFDDPTLFSIKWYKTSSPWLANNKIVPFIGPLTLDQVEFFRRKSYDMQRYDLELDGRILP